MEQRSLALEPRFAPEAEPEIQFQESPERELERLRHERWQQEEFERRQRANLRQSYDLQKKLVF